MTKRQWWVISGLGAFYTIIIGALQWYKYSTFGYNGLDLGIYHQVVWSLAHGHGFASSIHDPSYLGDHLELWLLPVSWIYRLWGSPLVLLWLQTILLASSIIPIAKITRRLVGPRAAVMAVALFLAHPFVYNVALYEFHALVFSLPITLWSIWLYLKKRYVWWLLTLIGLVLVREDMPFIVAGWSIMAAIDRRGWRWWAPPIFIAGVWFPIAQAVIKAANQDGVYKYLAFYGWMGSSFQEILTYPFRQPWTFLRHIITFNNFGTVIGLTVTFGFLPFFRMRRLWPVILIFAQLLIGNAQPGSFLKIHYTIPYLPFLFWATLETFRDIQSGRLYQRHLGASISATLATIIVIVGPLYSLFVAGPLAWPWTNRQSEATTSPATLRLALNNISPTDRVLTSFSFLPNLANRPNLYSLNYLYLGRRQYSEIPYRLPTDIDVAIIDWQQLYDFQFLYRTTIFEHTSGLQRISTLLEKLGLSPNHRYGSVVVYGRGDATSATSEPIDVPPTETETNMGKISLLGKPKIDVAAHQLRIITQWRANETKPDEFISLRYRVAQNQKTIWQQSQIIGQGLQPVSEWSKNSFWSTTDEIVLPVNIVGAVTVTAEIFVPSGRYRLNRLQTFRPIIDSQKILGTYVVGKATL